MNHSQSFIILLVEDEAADAGLVKWALKKNEMDVGLCYAIDGLDALAFLKQQGEKHLNAPRPDLILLDLNMPRMGGLEFLAKKKQEPSLNDIPVVVLSTSNAENDILSSHDLGAVDYFTKPMDAHELLETIRVLGERWITPNKVQEKASPKDLQHTIALLDSLPALPKLALEIMSITLSTDEGHQRLLKLVNQDPAILAKIIGLANAPLFGTNRKISTIREAAMRLGYKRIKMVALSFSMISSVSQHTAGALDITELWQHSMATALALDILAKAMPASMRPSEEDVYLAGLLHDIGFLVLDYVDPKLSKQFHTARINATGGHLLSEIESELLHMNHCQLGALLSEHWKLPADLIAVIRYHHTEGMAIDVVGQPLIAMSYLIEKLLPTFKLNETLITPITAAEWLALGIQVNQIEPLESSIRNAQS
ncbi:MAG: HDOD domain-containing protein [Mariprofundus sp.]|nr:HDOD domain-containing protein [Mariprofundus sp.]